MYGEYLSPSSVSGPPYDPALNPPRLSVVTLAYWLMHLPPSVFILWSCPGELQNLQTLLPLSLLSFTIGNSNEVMNYLQQQQQQFSQVWLLDTRLWNLYWIEAYQWELIRDINRRKYWFWYTKAVYVVNEHGRLFSTLFRKDSAGCAEKTAIYSADTPAQSKRGSLPSTLDP